MEDQILLLEKDPENNKILRDVLGKIHSIKGTAGSFGLKAVTNIFHQLEDHYLIDTKASINIIELSLKVIDVSREYVKSFTSGKHDELDLHEKFLKVFQKPDTQIKGRYLLNETDPFMVKLIATTFEKMGIEAALTNDGLEALGRILNEKFDGLITSYQTPTIDGINLTKMIRATDLIPASFQIIFITSDDDIDEFNGVNRLFRKRSTLKEQLREYLELIYPD